MKHQGNRAKKLLRILIAGFVLAWAIVGVAIPYYAGGKLVSSAESAPVWFDGAKLNKAMAFRGAMNALERERVLRGRSLYYFYLLAKDRSPEDQQRASRVIRTGAVNNRDKILAFILQTGTFPDGESGLDLDYEKSRDEPVRLLLEAAAE